MRIHLLSVGKRMPAWVSSGYDEYARRLPLECRLELVEIEPGKRSKRANTDVARREESSRLLAAIPKRARTIALDPRGSIWSTEELAARLGSWLGDGLDIALMVGGPDGLDDACRQHADWQWSLSRLTFPHPLVRVILAEQIYRAWSLLNGHPYHRGS